MGWISGLAAIVLAACAATGAGAAEPGASYATYDGRDYLMIWPTGEPSAVLVYLHNADRRPLAYEASSGMLEALASDAALRGYVVLAPAAGLNRCGAPEDASAERLACWRPEAAADDLGQLDRLLGHIEQVHGVVFETRSAIGYGRGGDFLAEALAERRLGRYAKIGLLDASPPVTSVALSGVAGPVAYIEAAEGDRLSAGQAADLLRALVNGGYGPRTCARGDPGDTLYDVRRLASFLAWFAQPCVSAFPGSAPGPSPVAPLASEPTPIAATAGESLLAEEAEEEERAEATQRTAPPSRGPR
jgi:hypothetical protein